MPSSLNPKTNPCPGQGIGIFRLSRLEEPLLIALESLLDMGMHKPCKSLLGAVEQEEVTLSTKVDIEKVFNSVLKH